ncbi:hypothetical protein SAMN05421742_10282 [Roseospirillum parvum]|uniref:Uncharacterized protein n=1 Tax=Roseospirillum parvum TaxID=83401 RepID=A0A1G7W7C2_9PROT|nr:hypothetical protein SAMN05421742_10282 [Roseospirillum parvum]
MEAALKEQAPAIPRPFAEALRLAAEQQERIEAQKARRRVPEGRTIPPPAGTISR